MREVDIAVIGAGIAGLTAAATAGRHGASVLLVDRLGVGGQVLTVDRIENFPGSPEPIAGVELGPMLQEQAENWGAELMLAEIAGISEEEERIVLDCDGERIVCRALIVAAGSTRRALGVPGEEALEGKGVSHCASCDGPMFRGMKVIVVGGGDSAFDEALVLSEQADEVVLAYRGAVPRAQKKAVERIAAAENVTERPRTTVEAIEGGDVVTGVRLKNLETGDSTTESADGVFVYIGLTPNTGFLNGVVELDEAGRIVTDALMRSSHPRIFAAGDIRAGSAGLLASCAGDGATAAVEAVRKLAGEGEARAAE